MLGNEEMFYQARNVAEPEFVEVLKSNGFIDVTQGDVRDDFNHVDVFGSKNNVLCKFDVKDLTYKYRYSRNYRISCSMMTAMNENTSSFVNHFIACRVYNNGCPNGEYIIVKSVDAATISKKKINRSTGQPFWMFNVDECIARFPHRIMKK